MKFPTKRVALPYTLSPGDEGVLELQNSGTLYVPATIPLMVRRFSVILMNQSAGSVTLESPVANLSVHGATETATIVIPAGRAVLLAAHDGVARWLVVNITNLSSGAPVGAVGAPVGAVGGSGTAVLQWGPQGGDTINGVSWLSNPTLANGGTFNYVLHVTNPSSSAVGFNGATAVYSKATGNPPPGVINVPAGGNITVTGNITVNGAVGSPGFIRLTLHDPFGAVQRSDINFVVGPAPVGAPPVGAPPVGGTGVGD